MPICRSRSEASSASEFSSFFATSHTRPCKALLAYTLDDGLLPSGEREEDSVPSSSILGKRLHKDFTSVTNDHKSECDSLYANPDSDYNAEELGQQLKQLNELLRYQMQGSADDFNHEVADALLQLRLDNPKFIQKDDDSEYNEVQIQQLINDIQYYDNSDAISGSFAGYTPRR